jgi:hypothetical protein
MKAPIAALTLITIVAAPLFAQAASTAAPHEAIKTIDVGQKPDSNRQLSQYCVPEDSQDTHNFYCRNWRLIPMGSQDRTLS